MVSAMNALKLSKSLAKLEWPELHVFGAVHNLAKCHDDVVAMDGLEKM